MNPGRTPTPAPPDRRQAVGDGLLSGLRIGYVGVHVGDARMRVGGLTARHAGLLLPAREQSSQEGAT